ncbi:MAG: GNAT family N-acetyltransferase [Candidatus Micrarchaeota archaeon]|nr:GNAT family N-acetyltransferase [Candidatus Micrarchaeota archaeon]
MLLPNGKKIRIEGAQVYLQSLGDENATADYVRWLSDPQVNKYLDTVKTTIPELKNFIRGKNASADCLFLGIFTTEGNRHIGNIKLEPKPYDIGHRRAAIGVIIGETSYWGKGIATEAIKLIVDYGFANMPLDEIYAGFIAGHESSKRAFEKVGFARRTIEERSGNPFGLVRKEERIRVYKKEWQGK